MTASGIHNPFISPQPKTEDAPPVSLTLDGDSYILIFENTTLKTVRERLFQLLYEVDKRHAKHLTTHGIYVGNNKDTAPISSDMLTLQTKRGFISVYSPSKKEDEVFRRVGYALSQLPIRALLKKQHVTITQRS